jgi:hypothetical protein
VGLKALLASAPLDGIDLDRGRDLGRDVAGLDVTVPSDRRRS